MPERKPTHHIRKKRNLLRKNPKEVLTSKTPPFKILMGSLGLVALGFGVYFVISKDDESKSIAIPPPPKKEDVVDDSQSTKDDSQSTKAGQNTSKTSSQGKPRQYEKNLVVYEIVGKPYKLYDYGTEYYTENENNRQDAMGLLRKLYFCGVTLPYGANYSGLSDNFSVKKFIAKATPGFVLDVDKSDMSAEFFERKAMENLTAIAELVYGGGPYSHSEEQGLLLRMPDDTLQRICYTLRSICEKANSYWVARFKGFEAEYNKNHKPKGEVIKKGLSDVDIQRLIASSLWLIFAKYTPTSAVRDFSINPKRFEDACNSILNSIGQPSYDANRHEIQKLTQTKEYVYYTLFLKGYFCKEVSSLGKNSHIYIDHPNPAGGIPRTPIDFSDKQNTDTQFLAGVVFYNK